MTSRKKYSTKFKTSVVLEALGERFSIAELAQKHTVHPQQISNWKREFLQNAEKAFTKGEKVKSKKSEQDAKEDELHKIIGQQKVEIDF